MQTLLRAACLVLVASLPWTPPTFAVTHTKAQKKTVIAKPRFIGTASRKHPASHVQLVYCDWHVCKDERPHYLGKASFYGKHYWQGRKMANGQRFDYRKLTVASWGIPLGTMVRITNLENGKSVVVEVTDRGPAHVLHRVADLSQAAAEQLDYIQQGTTMVMIQVMLDVEFESAAIEGNLIEPELLDLEIAELPVLPISGQN
jgi:rare lipoprotein A (peptidoglycan hydrolase)